MNNSKTTCKMKAKNNKTGEIVTNFGMSKEFGTISYIDSTNTLRFSTASDAEWTIIEEETSFDWQSFCNQAAKDILSKLITIGWYDSQNFGSMSIPDYRKTFVPCYTKEFAVTKAIEIADELCKQLKEKEEK